MTNGTMMTYNDELNEINSCCKVRASSDETRPHTTPVQGVAAVTTYAVESMRTGALIIVGDRLTLTTVV